MNIRTALSRSSGIVLIAMLAVVNLTGCKGPDSQHTIMREEARDAMDSMNAQIAYNQAKQSFEVGRFDRALKVINPIVERFPENAQYRTMQGRILYESGKLDLANRSFAVAIESDPEYAEAYYFKGIVEQRLADDFSAHESYNKAFELDPTNVQYLMAAAESKIAIGALDDAMEFVKSNESVFAGSAGVEQLKGQIALLKGDPQTGAIYYERALRLNPDDVSLAQELAWAQFDANQYGNCLDTLRRMKADFGTPGNDMQHLEARCLAGMGQTSDARNLYIELTRQDPNNTDLWVEFGLVAWEMGDYHRVLQCSSRVKSLDMRRYEGPLLQGVAARHHGRFNEAILQLQSAAKLAQDYALPYILLGNTFEVDGQTEQAREAYREALNIEPDNNEARILLARLDHEQRMRAATADGADAMSP